MQRLSHLRLLAVAAALCTASAVLSGPAAAGPIRTPSPPAGNGAAAGTLASGAAAEAPAQSFANSIGGLGHRAYRASFAGLTVDPQGGRVTVYSTNLDRARAMVDQGRAALPATARNATAVEIRPARYARPTLERAADLLWQRASSWRTAGAEIYSIVLRADGSGLEVRTSQPTQLAALMRGSPAAAELPVASADIKAVPGWQIKSLNRDNPSPPYPGGIPVRWDWEIINDYDCTTAFGVGRGSTEYLLTADHCFDVGDWVEDVNDDTVGVVREENARNDAEIIETDNNGAWTYYNQWGTIAVKSARWSWNGDDVCQSGRKNELICNITVTNEAVQWKDETGNTRVGVEGHRCPGCAAAGHGDSGGPVWNYRSEPQRIDARGIVSAGGVDVGSGNYEFIYWTEIPAVLNQMNLGIYILN